MNLLTIVVVTRPFSFEGVHRQHLADLAVTRLQASANTLIVIPNDRLLRLVNQTTRLTDAFRLADEVLTQAVRSISDLLTRTGLVNLDFADVRSVLPLHGLTHLGVGQATGPDRAQVAARQAARSPLLDVTIAGARQVIANVTGGSSVNLWEVHEAMTVIREMVHPDASVKFGAVLDEKMGAAVRVTVIPYDGFAAARKFGPIGSRRAGTPSGAGPHSGHIAPT